MRLKHVMIPNIQYDVHVLPWKPDAQATMVYTLTHGCPHTQACQWYWYETGGTLYACDTERPIRSTRDMPVVLV